MKIGVLGTGMVGHAIASRLAELGHRVMMGSREAANPKALEWAKHAGAQARVGTFAATAEHSEMIFNCTHGAHSLSALSEAGAKALRGKILVDVANILPPAVSGSKSLGEQIQKQYPAVKVVKALNTLNCALMVKPDTLPGPHTLFMSGNDADAKRQVRELLGPFGWADIIDLGDITTAAATENYLSLWAALWKALGTLEFNIKVVR